MQSHPGASTCPDGTFDTYLIGDRKRYRVLQLAHGDNVIILNMDATIRYLSASVERMLMRRHGPDLQGESILMLLHSKDMLNTRMMLERIVAGQAPALEWVTRLRTGERWDWFKARATRFSYAGETEPVIALFMMPLATP